MSAGAGHLCAAQSIECGIGGSPRVVQYAMQFIKGPGTSMVILFRGEEARLAAADYAVWFFGNYRDTEALVSVGRQQFSASEGIQ